MQVKINGKTINCEVLPLVSETLDESLDIFSFALNISKQATPFAAMQDVEVITDNNEKLLFVISSDSVSLASLDPVVYKHEIHCTQNTEKFKKKLVRNTVFSQPPNPWEIFNQPHSYCLGFATENTSLPDSINRYHASLVNSGFSIQTTSLIDMVTISTNKKVRRCLFKMDLKVAVKMQSGSVGSGITQWYYPQDSDELLNYFRDFTYSTISVRDNITVHYYDANGNPHSDTKTPLQLFGVNKWLFNQELEVEYFNDLLKAGCYDIYIGDAIDVQKLIDGDIYAVTETKSPVFYSINYKFKVETYYYSCYDVLDLLLKRQQQTYNGEGRDPLFKLKNSGDLHDLLVNTISPNYTFTQNTMYECVAEVFRLFDAIFTMDEDGYLDIEYFNDRSKEELPINTKIAGANLSLGENRFVNKLVSFYQNAKQEITHPNPQGFCKPRCEELGVPQNINNFSYLVEYDIDQLIEVNLLVTSVKVNVGWGSSAPYGFATGVNVTGNFLIDMTRYCVSKSLWATLSQVINDQDIKNNPQNRFQGNTISFDGKTLELCNTMKMSNGISYYSFNFAVLCAYWYQFGLTGAGQFGTINDISIYSINTPSVTYNASNQPDFANTNMQVKYIATLDGRTISESNTYKYDGEEMIDQYNGAVDLEKMGCNMLGINYKSGEPQLSVNQVIKTWSKRIKKGQILNYADEKWVANVCSYTILENGLISGQISFVKNFNALSLNTRLIREKRMSAISNELTMKSEDNIVEYAYYDVNPVGLVDDTLAIAGSKIVNGVLGSFDFSKANKTLFNTLDIGVITRDGIHVHPRRWLYAPLNKYSNGNGICYEIAYNSPLIAGNRTRYVTATDTWFGQNKWYTDYIKYTDDDGFLEKISVGIFRKAGNKPTSFSINDELFPQVNDNFTLKAVEIENYYCYKQPNEIFALNYQLSFIPVNETDVFFYPRFFKESLFLGESYCNRAVYLVTTHEKFSIFDMRVDSSLTLEEVTSITTNNYNKVTLTVDSSIDYYDDGGVAIVDADRNILFAYNTNENGSNDHIDIYFGYKRIREKIAQDVYALYVVFDNSQVDHVDVTLNGVTTTYYDSTSIPVEVGNTYSWVAANVTGYHITSGASGSGTISSRTTTIEVTSRESIYELIGTSANGTVTFYAYAGSTTPITSAKYGDVVFFTITANEGYNPPSNSANYIEVNETNFTLDDVDEEATRIFDPCTIKVFTFYVYAYNGTISGSYYNPTTDTTTTISVSNGGNQAITIEYFGTYDFDFEPLPNYDTDQTHYEGTISGQPSNIYCTASITYYNVSVSASHGTASGNIYDRYGNITSTVSVSNTGQSFQIIKGGSYDISFSYDTDVYYNTGSDTAIGSDVDDDVSITFSATAYTVYSLSVSASNGSAVGTIYTRSGAVQTSINISNTGQSFNVTEGASYELEFDYDDENYYATTATSASNNNVQGNESVTFSATAYPLYNLTLSVTNGTATGTIYNRSGTAVTSISLTAGGTVNTDVYQVIEGGSYSITYTYDDEVYYVTTATSASNNDMQSDESVTFSSTAYPMYTISISSGGGTTTGSTYNRAGTLVDTINLTNSSADYLVRQGGSYNLSFALTDSTNYYIEGTTSYNIADCQGDATYNFSASAYCWFNIDFSDVGVDSVTLTVDGTSTTYYASNGNVSVKYKQGLTYSWTTSFKGGYIAKSNATGSGTTSGTAVPIEPESQDITIPVAWNIWSPSVHQQSGVQESTWKATMAVKNSYFSNTTFYVNNNAITVPQNSLGFTGFTFANLGCQYIDVNLSTTAPSITQIDANIYLVDKPYTTVYPDAESNYSYRVYFIRAKLSAYNANTLPRNRAININLQFGLHQGFYLVDNGSTFTKVNRNIDLTTVYSDIYTSTNEADIVFNTSSSYDAGDDIIYLTVIVKNW